jgi:hypothetical protein
MCRPARPSILEMNMTNTPHGDPPSRFQPRCVILGIFLLAGALAACESVKQRISGREDQLSAAGFLVKPANNPERQAMLKKLPPNKFLRRENGDKVYYVYSDPVVCGCLYVGTQDAYNKFKANEQAKNLADEQQMTAETYQDAQWNWGAWGPWGGYGFAYGPYGW